MESTIRSDVEDTPRAVSSNFGKVRFGPFKLVRKGRGGIASASDTYRTTVYARSPGIYEPDQSGRAQFKGDIANLRPIAFEEFILAGTTERTVYATAELPNFRACLMQLK